MKELWEHQRGAVDFAHDRDGLGLFFETGTGKSRTAIEIHRMKNKRHGRMLRTLILTPKVVTFNWKKEYAMFAPEIPGSQVIVLHGTGAERLRQLQNTPSYFVVICSYETLLMEPVFMFLRQWKPEIAIADESHRIKNWKASRTKRSIVLSDSALYKFILSGTPITQNQADLFSQFQFLDGGATFGKNNFNFKQLFFEDANAKIRKFNKLVTWQKWVPRESRKNEFYSLVHKKVLVAKKSECLDLPPFVEQRIEVSMSPEQAKAYKQMKDDYITFLNSKAFTAQLAITKAMRLSQIMTGFVMGDGDNGESITHRFKDVPRIEALVELIQDLIEGGQKFIIWACWIENQQMINEALKAAKIEHRMLVGSMSAKQREEAMNDFRTKDDVWGIVGSQAAAGIGINLIEASASVYYSRSFSLEHDIQSVARNYRGGSEVHSKITRYDLVCPGTIDEEILAALQAKLEIADSIISKKVAV